MNTARLILLGAVFTQIFFAANAQAQAYSAKKLTRKVAPQTVPGRTNAPAQTATPTPVTPPAPVPARTMPTQAVVRVIQPPVDPEKARAAKEQAVRKTIEFQKKRAEEGSESAQYELGLRYLKGDGLEKDDTLARKWLTLSSKAGYNPATRKLEELDKPAEPPATERK